MSWNRRPSTVNDKLVIDRRTGNLDLLKTLRNNGLLWYARVVRRVRASMLCFFPCAACRTRV